MRLEEALASDRSSCIVLGQPGAGKTTAVKHICQRFFADNDYLSSFRVLLRIELRQINMVNATHTHLLVAVLKSKQPTTVYYPYLSVGPEESPLNPFVLCGCGSREGSQLHMGAKAKL